MCDKTWGQMLPHTSCFYWWYFKRLLWSQISRLRRIWQNCRIWTVADQTRLFELAISGKTEISFFMFRSSHFSFLVFCHFWRRSYENTKILHNLCLHFARQDVKNGKKITQLKWSKYQKPKDKNMRGTKHYSSVEGVSKVSRLG